MVVVVVVVVIFAVDKHDLLSKHKITPYLLCVFFFVLDYPICNRDYPYSSAGNLFRHLYEDQQWRLLGDWSSCVTRLFAVVCLHRGGANWR